MDNKILDQKYKDLYPTFLRDGLYVNKHINVMSSLQEHLRNNTTIFTHALKLHRPLSIQWSCKEYNKNINQYTINYNFIVRIKDIYQIHIYSTTTKYQSTKELLKNHNNNTLLNTKTYTDKGHHHYQYTYTTTSPTPTPTEHYYYLTILQHDGTRLTKAYPENDTHNPNDPLHNHEKTLDNLGQLLNIRRLNLTTRPDPTQEELKKYYPPYFVKYNEKQLATETIATETITTETITTETITTETITTENNNNTNNNNTNNNTLLTEYTEDDHYYQTRITKYIQKLYQKKADTNNTNLLPIINLWKNYQLNNIQLKNRHTKLAKQTNQTLQYYSTIDTIKITHDGTLTIINNPSMEKNTLKLQNGKIYYKPIKTNNYYHTTLNMDDNLNLTQTNTNTENSTGQNSQNYRQTSYYDTKMQRPGTYNPCTYELIITNNPPLNIKPLNDKTFQEDVNNYLPITRQAIIYYLTQHDYRTSIRLKSFMCLISNDGQNRLEPETLTLIPNTIISLAIDGELNITYGSMDDTYTVKLQNGVLYQRRLENDNVKGELKINNELNISI